MPCSKFYLVFEDHINSLVLKVNYYYNPFNWTNLGHHYHKHWGLHDDHHCHCQGTMVITTPTTRGTIMTTISITRGMTGVHGKSMVTLTLITERTATATTMITPMSSFRLLSGKYHAISLYYERIYKAICHSQDVYNLNSGLWHVYQEHC